MSARDEIVEKIRLLSQGLSGDAQWWEKMFNKAIDDVKRGRIVVDGIEYKCRRVEK